MKWTLLLLFVALNLFAATSTKDGKKAIAVLMDYRVINMRYICIGIIDEKDEEQKIQQVNMVFHDEDFERMLELGEEGYTGSLVKSHNGSYTRVPLNGLCSPGGGNSTFYKVSADLEFSELEQRLERSDIKYQSADIIVYNEKKYLRSEQISLQNFVDSKLK